MRKMVRMCACLLCTLGLMCSCIKNESKKDVMLMNVDEFSNYFASVTAEYKDILFTELDSMLIGYQNTLSINNKANVILAGLDSFPLYNSNIMDYITALLTGNFSFFATAFSHVPHGRLDVDFITGTVNFEPFEPTPDAGKLILNAILGKDSTYTAIFEADHLFNVQIDSTIVPLASNISVRLLNRKGTLDQEKTCLSIDYHMQNDDQDRIVIASANMDMIGDRHFTLNTQVDESQFVLNVTNNVLDIELLNAKYVMVGRDFYSSLFSPDINAKVLMRHIQADFFEKQLRLDIDVDNFFSKITPNKDKLLSIILQFFIQGADSWRGTTSSVLNSCFGVNNFVSMFNDMNIMISAPYNLGFTNPIARIKLSTEYSDEDYVISYIICNDYSTRPFSEFPIFGYKNVYELGASVLNKFIDKILNQ